MGNQGRVGDQFRERLKAERKRRDWSQEDVAKMLSDKGIHGVYATTIAKIEAGDRAVRIDELTGIADLFEVSLDQLLGRNVGPEQDLAFTLRTFLDTARQSSFQISSIWRSLHQRLSELSAFEFEGRDDVVKACGRVYDALSEANVALQHIPAAGGVVAEGARGMLFDELLEGLVRGLPGDETQS